MKTVICKECGGENVLFDAWARWSVEAQRVELSSHHDNTECCDCDGECSVEEREIDGTTRYAVQQKSDDGSWFTICDYGTREDAEANLLKLDGDRVIPVWP